MAEEAQQIDLVLLEEIRSGIEYQAPEISDYLMLSEMTRVTHLKHGRIHYALKYGKKRPLYGIKRGDRWFVHRLDALQWAQEVASDQQQRWKAQADRLGQLVRREQIRGGIVVPPPEQRQRRDPLPAVPKGILTYTYAEAARMLNLSTASVQQYLSLAEPLLKIQRYRSEDGRVVLSAADVGAAAMERKQKQEDDKRRKREVAERRAAMAVVANERGAA